MTHHVQSVRTTWGKALYIGRLTASGVLYNLIEYYSQKAYLTTNSHGDAATLYRVKAWRGGLQVPHGRAAGNPQ